MIPVDLLCWRSWIWALVGAQECSALLSSVETQQPVDCMQQKARGLVLGVLCWGKYMTLDIPEWIGYVPDSQPSHHSSYAAIIHSRGFYGMGILGKFLLASAHGCCPVVTLSCIQWNFKYTSPGKCRALGLYKCNLMHHSFIIWRCAIFPKCLKIDTRTMTNSR